MYSFSYQNTELVLFGNDKKHIQPWQEKILTPVSKALCKWGHFEGAKHMFKILPVT